MTYVWETSYFFVSLTCHTIAYKIINISLKMSVYIQICYLVLQFDVKIMLKISMTYLKQV